MVNIAKKTLSLLISLLFLSSCGNKHAFSSTEWMKENNYKERYLMLDDFASKYDIRGYTNDEVITLLGDPDNLSITWLETDPLQSGGYSLSYYVESGNYVDTIEALQVNSNSNKKVYEVLYVVSNELVKSIYSD